MKRTLFIILFSCIISHAALAEEASVLPTVPTNITADPQFQSIQSQILNDTDIMADIQALITDPDVMSLLSDPALMALVMSGNSTTLQADPRVTAIAQNPKVQALIEKIKAKQPAAE